VSKPHTPNDNVSDSVVRYTGRAGLGAPTDVRREACREGVPALLHVRTVIWASGSPLGLVVPLQEKRRRRGPMGLRRLRTEEPVGLRRLRTEEPVGLMKLRREGPWAS